jgi:hypothetical protein
MTTNDGFEAGEKAELQQVIDLIMEHKSVPGIACGFAGMCACGSPYDDYRLHLLAVLKNRQKSK